MALIPFAMSRASIAVYISVVVLASHFVLVAPQLCVQMHSPLRLLHPSFLLRQSAPFACLGGFRWPPCGAVIMRFMLPGSYFVKALKPHSVSPKMPDRKMPNSSSE